MRYDRYGHGEDDNAFYIPENIRARRQRMRERRRIDVRYLIIAAVMFAVVVIMNIFQTNRPTSSELEKRELAKFPEFSIESLMSGKFTEGINAYFADTFVFRDSLVAASKKLDSLRGYSYSLGGGDDFVLLSPGVSKDNNSEVGDILDGLHEGTADSTEAPDTESDRSETLRLSKTSLSLTVGGGAVISAESDGTLGTVTWHIDDGDVVSLTSDGATATLKGISEGTAQLTCSDGNTEAKCKISVTKVSSGGVDNGDTADFMTNGLFIYGDAVYSQGWYDENYAGDYARTVAYYKQIFPKSRISVCVIPTSAIKIDNADVKEKIPDQTAIFSRLREIIGSSSVNFVNVYDELYAHRDEYIYFKSDHHWTQRGAYYAYKAFVESIGLEATQLDDFDMRVLTDSYSGSMYSYTQDERVKNFKDSVEAYLTKKKLTMTVTDRSGSTSTYDSAIMTWSQSYSAFLCGDNPYTVINVPENPQNRNILVLKDSYGNAMVPYLAENFGNIMVVDTRYSDINVATMFADYDLTDILFINNLEAANSPAWAKMYLRAAGVAVD